jgi:hypothetical protein
MQKFVKTVFWTIGMYGIRKDIITNNYVLCKKPVEYNGFKEYNKFIELNYS